MHQGALSRSQPGCAKAGCARLIPSFDRLLGQNCPGQTPPTEAGHKAELPDHSNAMTERWSVLTTTQSIREPTASPGIPPRSWKERGHHPG